MFVIIFELNFWPGQNGRRYADGIFSDSEICQHTFR